MCGINGILGHMEDAAEQLNRMNNAIVHRGPDSEGCWYDEQAAVALGHRRLSIIDLSPNGAQPMISASKRFVIVFNGEIYNYREIADDLSLRYTDLHFRGTSDTELLLEAIDRIGIEATLSRIKGMFAFAVLDRELKKVYLARDRMGEKPLYYGKVADCFVFASDIASIEKLNGFDNKIEDRILTSYFRSGYIPAPYTIYKDIYKLEPGCMLTIEYPYHTYVKKKYWDIKQVAAQGQANPYTGSFEEAGDRLEELIKASIKGQLISDVPLGAFLSGGIDSSLTVSLMQSISEKPIRTFTIGFEDEKYNEAQYAAETAKHLGTVHTEMYVTREDILEAIRDIPKAYTEPFADSSQIPTMLVSRMTKQHVTVAISGDAGDEFFCGYNTYRDVTKGLEILAGKLPFIKGSMRRELGLIVRKCGGMYNESLRKLVNVLSINSAEDWYRNVRDDDMNLCRLSRCGDSYRDNIDLYCDNFLEGNEPNLMLMDMLQYLPDDILVKVDRAGMLYSLENRIPLLDKDVMEFAWSLPQEYKYDGITTKRILKHILYKYVPQEMMERPKKGFSVPLASWLRGGELSEWASSLIEESDRIMGDYVNTDIVKHMWKQFIASGEGERNIWTILMLAQWMDKKNG